MSKIKNNTFKNIGNGNGNTTVIGDVTVEQKERKISDDYEPQDYASKKKTINIAIHRIAFAVGFIVDLIALIQTLNLALQPLRGLFHLANNTTELYNNTQPNITMLGGFLIFFALLFMVLVLHYDMLSALRTKGFYKSYYYNDNDLYKIQTKRCPKCNGKITIKNEAGKITFSCAKSASHSKEVDITELDNLPSE